MRLTSCTLLTLGLAPMVMAITAASYSSSYDDRDVHSTSPNFTSNPAGYDTSRVGPSNANCQRQTYPLSITSNNTVFQNVNFNANQTALTALYQTYLTSQQNFTEMYQNGTQQVSNTYMLSGTFCTPNNINSNSSHVQLLLHGVGFDSSYWDFSPDGSDGYSYVSAAADAGFTTFSYDRLGTGLSEHPQDAYNVVQAHTDLAIVTQFAIMLRSGFIGGINFTKVIGVGHSYGAIQLQALSATAPELLDAVLLQGFSMNSTGVGTFIAGAAFESATTAAPNRFFSNDLTNAYVINGSPYANQFDFFYFPYFSDAALQRCYLTEQPVTNGVLFTQATLSRIAPDFSGAVHVVIGAQDLAFCARNCYAVPENSSFSSVPAFVQELYPGASSFTVYIPENTGHGINVHYSAPETYQEMLRFVSAVFDNSTTSAR